MDPSKVTGWPEAEAILPRLRQWLEETGEEVQRLSDDPDYDDLTDQRVGLYQFVEHLTTLRQEVKLLTKACRGIEQRNEATLAAMQDTLEPLRTVQANESAAADQAARPLVIGLIELDEALRRGRRAFESGRQRIFENAQTDLRDARERFEQLWRSQPWWRRRLCRSWHVGIQQIFEGRTLDKERGILASLLEGYDLIQGRLQRTLDEQSISRIECVGKLLDPHTMTVIETVSDPTRQPGVVIEELRSGYYWKSKVLRFAEVKTVGEH